MNLRGKLLLAALILVLFPVILLMVTLGFMNRYQARYLQKDYGYEQEVDWTNFNASEVYHFEKDYLRRRLKTDVSADDTLLHDTDYLQELNREMTGRSCYIMAGEEDAIFFSGEENNGEMLAFLQETDLSEEECVLFCPEKDSRYLVGELDDFGPVTIYLVMLVSGSVPAVQQNLYVIVFVGFFGLIVAALLLVYWIQNSMIRPMEKLKKATREIKEGNLNYSVEVRGNDEFAELCRDFEDMRLRLKDNAEERLRYEQENKVLLSDISHDLKTPLTAVKGYVEGIMDGVASSPEKLDKYIRTIYNKTIDMNRLVDELTLYSKIDTNRVPYNFLKICATDYFEDCVEEIRTDLDARGIDLFYQNNLKGDEFIVGDPEQLKRVINNIISNSVKYMDKSKGIISLRLREENDSVRVEIEDNGKGIAAKDLPLIFDRFYRTDSSRNSKTGGSGIGLSIVKKIIEDHGGRIWATSREGIGTTMYFELRKIQEAQG